VEPCLLAYGVQVGAQGWWSMAKVKVMWVRVDGPGSMKDECWDLTEGAEKPLN
jgi:hypothetical protein